MAGKLHEQEATRKGARRAVDIPPAVLQRLNSGRIPSVNLVEWMAINRRVLLGHVLKAHGRGHYTGNILADVDRLKKQGISAMDDTIGAGLLTEMLLNNDMGFAGVLSNHPADLVRCWAAYAIGKDETLSVKQKFARMKPLAADPHFIVREIAWIALRHIIEQNLAQSIDILTGWAKSKDANLRRFASEATRPRGVWCRHLPALRNEPEKALCILESLKCDTSKYVRDSVGNWLNDAGKTREDFLLATCKRWRAEGNSKETAYIIKRAMRSLNK